MKKAELFKDKHAIKRLKDLSSGHQCKIEGSKVKNFDRATWEQEAYRLCLPGVRQKFITNAVPHQLLLSKTKGKRLVECSKDATWGCGMAIHNDKCLDTSLWTSQGIMGKMLEEIRRELSGDESMELPPLPDFDNSEVSQTVAVSQTTTVISHSTAHKSPKRSPRQGSLGPLFPTAPEPTSSLNTDSHSSAARNEQINNMDIDRDDDSSTASSSSDEDNSD